jgi:capsular polysaccharide transport system permease protein
MAVESPAIRSTGAVTWSVWKALFLREAIHRVSRERAAWVWILVEPCFHIAFLMFMFATIRIRVVGGIDTLVWILVGLLAFFMFRRPAQQGMAAVGANFALFTFRQVKPVDTVLVRCALEGFLMVLVSALLLVGAGLFGVDVFPANPLYVLVAVIGMWLCGVGFALITSVASELVPESGRLINMSMHPFYLFSGIVFPIDKLPSPYREWLLLNPLVHGLEAARVGFAPLYRAVPELSVPYLYGFALCMIFLGMALHQHFAIKLRAR